MPPLDCIICRESHDYLKYLNCSRHALCLMCIDKLSKKRNEKTFIVCPYDLTETEFDHVKCLKTKFGVHMLCVDCSEKNVLDKCWWCRDCETTTCSTCAMKKHRDHSCNCWDNLDIVKDFIDLLKNPDNVDFTCACASVEKLADLSLEFGQLLKFRCTFLEESRNFMEAMSNVFGHVSNSSTTLKHQPIKNVERGLESIVQILQSIDRNYKPPNCQILSQGLGNTKTLGGKFQPLRQALDSLITPNRESTNLTIKTKFVVKSVQHANAANVVFEGSGNSQLIWYKRANLERRCVKAVCAAANGFVLNDELGLSYYKIEHESLVCNLIRLHSDQSMGEADQISFSDHQQTVLLINDKVGRYFEFDLADLCHQRTVALPWLSDSFPKCKLIYCFDRASSHQKKEAGKQKTSRTVFAVLNDGRSFCAFTDKKFLYIWILRPKDCWTCVWSSRKAEYAECLSVFIVKRPHFEEVFIEFERNKLVSFSVSKTNTVLNCLFETPTTPPLGSAWFCWQEHFVNFNFKDNTFRKFDNNRNGMSNQWMPIGQRDLNEEDVSHGRVLILANYAHSRVYMFDVSNNNSVGFFIGAFYQK